MKYELIIPASCSFEQWKRLCSETAQVKNASSWAIADLMVFADMHNWLEDAISHLIGLGYRRATALNYLRVGIKFPRKQRQFALSFSHYMRVSGQNNATELLRRAEKGDGGVPWSFDQLHSHLAVQKAKEEDPVLRPLTRPKKQLRYNRPHDEDPLGTFANMCQQVALSVREMASALPKETRLLQLVKLDAALRRLLLARNVLANSLRVPSVPAPKDLHEIAEQAIGNGNQSVA